MIPKLQMEGSIDKKQNVNLSIEVPHMPPEQDQFTFREKKNKNKQNLKELEIKDNNISRSIQAIRNKLMAANESQQIEQENANDQKRNKNRSEIYTKKRKGQQNEQDNSHHEYQRFNYKSRCDLNTANNINKNNADKYQNKIKYLEDHIDELQNQKYKREQYLIKVINKNSKLSNQMKASSSSIAATARSRISANFDVNQYIQTCQKQREQAKLIQMKAMKLKKKEKLSRQLLKKMRSKLNTERSNVTIGMGMDMEISAVSVIQKQAQQNKNKANNLMLKSNGQKLMKIQMLNKQSQMDDQLDDAQMNIGQSRKNQSVPSFFNEEQSIDLDKRISIDASKQLKEQITHLKQQIIKSHKQLQSEKTTRQNYQKHIFEIDNKNAQMIQKYTQRITDLEQQVVNKDEQIKKLENLLDQNIKLLKTKQKKIQQLYCEIKMKASLVDSLGFGGSSGSNGEESPKTNIELDLVWRVLNRLKNSKQQYFKQFLMDSVVGNDKSSDSLSQQLKYIKQKQEQKEKQKKQRRQQKQKQKLKEGMQLIEGIRERELSQQSISMHDDSFSDSNSVPSEAMAEIANQNQDLKQSVQMLSSKLKSIQNKLQKAENQKNTIFLTHSSLSTRIMTLEQENAKIQQMKQKFSTQNLQLKHKLAESNNLSESLKLQKQRIRQQSQSNIKTLMKMMQQQKNKQIANKIQEIARQLQKDLNNKEQQKKKLQNKVKVVQFQNDTFTNLNKQLQSQVKSQQELSYQLQQIINKQKIQIQKLQESVDKIKDDNDKFIQRTQFYDAEKIEWTEINNKLKQQVQMLNSLICNSNEQIMKFKIMLKQKMLESAHSDSQTDDVEQQKSNEQEKLKQKIQSHQVLISKLQGEIKQNQSIILQLEQSLKTKQSDLQKNKIQLTENHDKISQLQIQIDVLNKKIEGLQLIIKNKNSELKQNQEKINQNSSVTLKQQQNYKSQINMLEQKVITLYAQLKQKQDQVERKQDEKQKIMSSTSQKIQQLQSQLKKIQAQLQSQQAQLAELAKLRIQLSQINVKIQLKQKQISALQQQLQNQKEQHLHIQIDLDLSNKKIQQYIQKNKSLQTTIKQLQNKKPDLSQQNSTLKINEIYYSSMKQYNRQLYEICRHFSLKIVQLQLIKQVINYLPIIQDFVKELSQYTEVRQQRLQGYLSKYDDIIQKQPMDVGITTPQITSSPLPLKKQEDIQKRSRFAVKAAQSLEVNLDLHEDYFKQQFKNADQAQKKSILLSEDFGSAFSHEDQQNDHIDHINSYKGKDGINQRSMSREAKKTDESLGFSGSTHSLVQQLQAQQQIKKQMRNLKMKAKQKKRKI